MSAWLSLKDRAGPPESPGIDIHLLGSGFGAVRLDEIFAAIPGLFALAASGEVKIDVERVPLSDVETAWNRVDKGRRIVFTM